MCCCFQVADKLLELWLARHAERINPRDILPRHRLSALRVLTIARMTSEQFRVLSKDKQIACASRDGKQRGASRRPSIMARRRYQRQ